MALGIDPTVDYVFKKLFADPANKDLLIHLLNAILPPPMVVDVEILNPFNEKDFANDKLSVLDIKAVCDNGVRYNIEIQSKAHWSLPPRLACYCANLYVSQLHEGEDYAALRPGITICFLKQTLFHETDAPHARFTLRDCELDLELTDRLQIHTIELSKYNFQGVSLELADHLAQWAYFLNFAADLNAEELKQRLPQPEFVKATEVVEMIAKTPEERMRYEARRKAELDFRSFVADARREGREEGISLGEAKAHKRSLVEQVQLLQDLLQVTITPIDQLLDLDEAELTQLRVDLRQQFKPRP